MSINTTCYIHIRTRRVGIHSILTMNKNSIRGTKSSGKESMINFIILTLVKWKGYQDVVYHIYGKNSQLLMYVCRKLFI